jgi:hypothetical protein
MRSSTVWLVVLGMFVSLLASSCTDEGSPTEPPVPPEGQAPVVAIQVPTSEISYVTTEAQITLSGLASDDGTLTLVAWATDRGYSGTASGLDDWTAANVPLEEGDNVITVSATDDDGDIGNDQLTVTRNLYLTFLGRPEVDPAGVFVGATTDVLVRATIAPNENLIESSVALVRLDESNAVVDTLGQLYDDGDLGHGDDIFGDGVFSAIRSFNEPAAGDVRLRVVASTQEASGEVDGYSAIFVLTVVEEISQAVVSEVFDTQEAGEAQLETYMQSHSDADAKSMTVDWLKQQSNVTDAGVTGSGDIWIDYSSGLTGMIMIVNEDEEGGSGRGRASRAAGASVAIPFQTRGLPPGETAPLSALGQEEDAVLNKNAFLYAPRYTEFSGWGTEFLNDLNTLLEGSTVPDFEVDYVKDGECTVDALKAMPAYGLVVIHTHGGVRKGEVVFLTAEEATLSGYLYHLIDWVTGCLTTATINGKTYWLVTPSFVSTLVGTFPNSIIYNGSCESAYNSTMANAFLGKGANTYFGFSQTVYSSFDRQMADDLFPKLVTEHQTTGEAFTPGQHDAHVDNPAYFVMIGSDKTYFEVGLVNGDFEEGDLTGWNRDGDGRVITQLGTESPAEGAYMGIISTGLGFTEATGSISQGFLIEEGVTTLSLRWNFLSEEFMEYVGSQYQDYFRIAIEPEDGAEVVIFYKAIDDIANEYSLVEVSPGIVFDQGDVYMTGWQQFTYDVSSYAGKGAKLTLSAGDIGDSIYDTAILLDDIKVE